MLENTFLCAPGIGPSRERELWSKGFRCWDDVPDRGLILSPRLDDGLRRAVAEVRELAARRDAAGLAARVPVGERWRLWPTFRGDSCCLDIETGGAPACGGPIAGHASSSDVTVVGILDANGPRTFLKGRNLEELPAALERYRLIVTFNGASFDLPILKDRFPGLPVPPIHVDLRVVFRKLGEPGGLKKLEERLGLPRPGSVRGLRGSDAVRLWRAWDEGRDGRALRLLVEYNLYDAIQLRPLADLGYNRMAERTGLPVAPLQVYQRGDVLYDVTRILEALPVGDRQPPDGG